MEDFFEKIHQLYVFIDIYVWQFVSFKICGNGIRNCAHALQHFSTYTHTQKRSNTIFEAANYVHDRYKRIHVASNNKWDEIRTTNDKYFVLFINILMFRVFKWEILPDLRRWENIRNQRLILVNYLYYYSGQTGNPMTKIAFLPICSHYFF